MRRRTWNQGDMVLESPLNVIPCKENNDNHHHDDQRFGYTPSLLLSIHTPKVTKNYRISLKNNNTVIIHNSYKTP